MISDKGAGFELGTVEYTKCNVKITLTRSLSPLLYCDFFPLKICLVLRRFFHYFTQLFLPSTLILSVSYLSLYILPIMEVCSPS